VKKAVLPAQNDVAGLAFIALLIEEAPVITGRERI